MKTTEARMSYPSNLLAKDGIRPRRRHTSACFVPGLLPDERCTRITFAHTNERPFECAIEGCGKTFKVKNEQTRHEKSQHGVKTFICGGVLPNGEPWGCGKAFSRSDGLLEHHTKTAKGRQCAASRDNE